MMSQSSRLAQAPSETSRLLTSPNNETSILKRRAQFRKDFAQLLCSQPNTKAGHLVDLVNLKQKHSAIKEDPSGGQ